MQRLYTITKLLQNLALGDPVPTTQASLRDVFFLAIYLVTNPLISIEGI